MALEAEAAELAQAKPLAQRFHSSPADPVQAGAAKEQGSTALKVSGDDVITMCLLCDYYVVNM